MPGDHGTQREAKDEYTEISGAFHKVKA
jgi:hypothetical protein